MSSTTYRGIVRNSKIEPTPAVELPEGSEVYVVVPAAITAHVAKRKAQSEQLACWLCRKSVDG